MRWTSQMAGAAAAASLFALAPPAQAAVTTFTYTGAFRSGLDTTGVFGPAMRDLTGIGFTAVFTRNDAIAPDTLYDDGVMESFVIGFNPPVLVTGEITVDGVTWRFRADHGSQHQIEEKDFCGAGCDRENFGHLVSASLNGNDPAMTRYFYDASFLDLGAVGFGTDVLTSHDYRTLADVVDNEDLNFVGQLRIAALTNDLVNSVTLLDADARGILDPVSLTVTTSAAVPVPEPSAWALMILGFGGMGAALRARRRRPVATGYLSPNSP